MRHAFLAILALASLQSSVNAQVQNAGFEADYEASGFVAPAGMPSPEEYYSAVEQASFFGGNGPLASQMQGCEGGCGAMGCNGGCDMSGGYYGESGCGGCGAEGCQSCGGLNNYRFMCLFCRGEGCSVCQSIGRVNVLACLRSLLPYSEAGLCAQRWYDVSADAMFLGRNSGGLNQVLTTRGRFDQNPVAVLRASDAEDDDLEAGVRLSAAFIFGAGGNVELTYLGGQEWEDTAIARTNTTTTIVTGMGVNQITSVDGDLFSVLSGFGANPLNGQDDTDRSLSQSVRTYSTFHSAEVNYRRRTVEQFCRFQGSWLVGLRYLRFDDDFGYFIRGADDNTAAGNLPRFFDYNNGVDNKMFGAQGGFDVWWNVIAGVNLGLGVKGAWLDNNIDRHSSVNSNSIGPGATPGTLIIEDGINKSTFMTELEATLLYRISHSWTLKSQYYFLTVEDVAFGADLSPAQNVYSQGTIPISPIATDSLNIQGVALGAEYIW